MTTPAAPELPLIHSGQNHFVALSLCELIAAHPLLSGDHAAKLAGIAAELFGQQSDPGIRGAATCKNMLEPLHWRVDESAKIVFLREWHNAITAPCTAEQLHRLILKSNPADPSSPAFPRLRAAALKLWGNLDNVTCKSMGYLFRWLHNHPIDGLSLVDCGKGCHGIHWVVREESRATPTVENNVGVAGSDTI